MIPIGNKSSINSKEKRMKMSYIMRLSNLPYNDNIIRVIRITPEQISPPINRDHAMIQWARIGQQNLQK